MNNQLNEVFDFNNYKMYQDPNSFILPTSEIVMGEQSLPELQDNIMTYNWPTDNNSYMIHNKQSFNRPNVAPVFNVNRPPPPLIKSGSIMYSPFTPTSSGDVSVFNSGTTFDYSNVGTLPRTNQTTITEPSVYVADKNVYKFQQSGNTTTTTYEDKSPKTYDDKNDYQQQSTNTFDNNCQRLNTYENKNGFKNYQGNNYEKKFASHDIRCQSQFQSNENRNNNRFDKKNFVRFDNQHQHNDQTRFNNNRFNNNMNGQRRFPNNGPRNNFNSYGSGVERRGQYDNDRNGQRRNDFDNDRRGQYDNDRYGQRRNQFDDRRGQYDNDRRRNDFDNDRRGQYDNDRRRNDFDNDRRRNDFDNDRRRNDFDNDRRGQYDNNGSQRRGQFYDNGNREIVRRNQFDNDRRGNFDNDRSGQRRNDFDNDRSGQRRNDFDNNSPQRRVTFDNSISEVLIRGPEPDVTQQRYTFKKPTPNSRNPNYRPSLQNMSYASVTECKEFVPNSVIIKQPIKNRLTFNNDNKNTAITTPVVEQPATEITEAKKNTTTSRPKYNKNNNERKSKPTTLSDFIIVKEINQIKLTDVANKSVKKEKTEVSEVKEDKSVSEVKETTDEITTPKQ